MFVRFAYLLAGFTLASGKPILMSRLDQDASQLSFDVTLESLGNTTVQAQVTNTGSEGVRLVRRGGILDPVATKKVIIHGGEAEADFTGAYVGYHLSHLTDEGFVQVSPNQTVTSVFDIDTFYTLTADEDYTAVATGVLEYTTLNDTKKFHTFVYESNNITFTAPADVKRLKARSTLDCTNDSYNTKVQNAITRAAKMATAGAADARSGASDTFQKFFFTTDQDALDEVAGRLEAIATEATTTGLMTYYCAPRAEDDCSGNVAAMTYPSEDVIVNCDLYYSTEAESNYCGYLDQGGIALHEYTHATGVYAPGTDDVVYGYDSVQALDTTSALNNADSYAYYAAAIYLQCPADDSATEGTPLDIDLGGSTSATATATATETATQSAGSTSNPQPTSTSTSTSGSDWPWGQAGSGSDSGSGLFPTDTSTAPTNVPTPGVGAGTGSGTGGYGNGGYGNFPPTGSWPSSGPDSGSGTGGFGGYGQGPWGSGWFKEASQSGSVSSGSGSGSGAAPTATFATSGIPGPGVTAAPTATSTTTPGASADSGTSGSGVSFDIEDVVAWLKSIFGGEAEIQEVSA